MRGARWHRQSYGAKVAAVVAALVLGAAAGVAAAQDEDPLAPDPAQTQLPDDAAGTTGAPDPQPGDDDTITDESAAPSEAEEQFESAAPSELPPAAQKVEAARACAGAVKLPASGMRASRQGTAVGDDGSLLGVIVAAAVTLFAFAFVWRRLRGRLTPTDQSPLELVAVIVATCAGLAGIAAQFVPGWGVRDRPPPAATMEVSQVHARVKYDSFARAVDAARRPDTSYERRELGNVAWVELQLDGYGGKDLVLDWAEYNVDTGGALLPGTEDSRPIPIRHDRETPFEPVWVGYPRSGRFQVQFRLLDEGGQVRAMARTGPMRGTRYRYAC